MKAREVFENQCNTLSSSKWCLHAPIEVQVKAIQSLREEELANSPKRILSPSVRHKMAVFDNKNAASCIKAPPLLGSQNPPSPAKSPRRILSPLVRNKMAAFGTTADEKSTIRAPPLASSTPTPPTSPTKRWGRPSPRPVPPPVNCQKAQEVRSEEAGALPGIKTLPLTDPQLEAHAPVSPRRILSPSVRCKMAAFNGSSNSGVSTGIKAPPLVARPQSPKKRAGKPPRPMASPVKRWERPSRPVPTPVNRKQKAGDREDNKNVDVPVGWKPAKPSTYWTRDPKTSIMAKLAFFEQND